MGGICAIFDDAPESRLRERAAPMLAVSPYRGESFTACAPGALLAIQHRGGEASLAGDEHHLVAYLGTGSANADLPHADALLARLRDGLSTALASLPADVAVVVYEKASRQVHFATGLAMTRPLFHHAGHGGLVIASEIRQLCAGAGIAQRLDPEALAEILLFHGPLRDGRRTAYCDVSRALATEHYGWRPGDRSARRVAHYWQPPSPGVCDLRDIPELARELRGLLGDAVAAAGSPGATLSLSGGLDSTSLWALLQQQGRHSQAVALAFPGFAQDESANVRALLRHTHSDAPIIDATTARPSDYMQAHSEQLDGIPGAPTLYYLDLLGEHLKAGGSDAHISGIGAECQLSPGLDYTADLVRRGHLLRALGDLLRFQDYQPTSAGTLARLKRALRLLLLPPGSRLRDRLRPVRPPAWLAPRWGDLYRDCRQAMWRYHRELGCEQGAKWFGLMHYGVGSGLENVEQLGERYGVSLRTPFLARPVTEFGFRVPSRVLLGARRQKHLLRVAMADLLPAPILEQDRKVVHADLARQDLAMLELAGSPTDWQLVQAGIVDPDAVLRWQAQMRASGRIAATWSQLIYGELFARRYLD